MDGLRLGMHSKAMYQVGLGESFRRVSPRAAVFIMFSPDGMRSITNNQISA